MDDTSGETTVVELPEITIRGSDPRISRGQKKMKKSSLEIWKIQKKVLSLY